MKLIRNNKTWTRNQSKSGLPWECEQETLDFLYSFVRLIKPKKIFEIGTFEGDSAIAMANALKKNDEGGELYTVDIKDYGQFERLRGYINIHSLLGHNKTYPDDFDMVFIDDGHTYIDVTRDLLLADNLIGKSGYILGHDPISTKTVFYAYTDFIKRKGYEHMVLDSYAGIFIIKKSA